MRVCACVHLPYLFIILYISARSSLRVGVGITYVINRGTKMRPKGLCGNLLGYLRAYVDATKPCLGFIGHF